MLISITGTLADCFWNHNVTKEWHLSQSSQPCLTELLISCVYNNIIN